MRFRRKAEEVIATQYTKDQSHPALFFSDLHQFSAILTDFCIVEVEYGDWIVEIGSKVKVLKDEYFKEHYEVIPEKVTRPKLIIVTDCE